jgi:ADP-ribose pyrophosphatase YjhB (NUDIX family)
MPCFNSLIYNNVPDINVKVGVIITDQQNRILLIKEKLPKKDGPLWNVIKGTYGDHGNATIFDAAVRECRE